MLPPHLTELLTAYVDGEVTSSQRKAVTRLLKRSAEARRLLEQLECDSSELRRLPRARAPKDFANPVMAAILRHQAVAAKQAAVAQVTARPPAASAPLPIIRPVAARRSTARSRLLFAFNAAVAASVMLAAGAGSFWFLSHLDPHAPDLARKGTEAETRSADRPSTGPQEKRIEDEPQLVDAPMIHEFLAVQPYGPLLPAMRTPSEAEHYQAMLRPKPQPFVHATPSLMLIASLKEVGQPGPGEELVKAVQRGGANRLDLFSTDLTRGFDRLQAVFAANGVTLNIDAEVKARLARHQRPALTLYSEDLTADELNRILRQLAADDRKSSSAAFGVLTLNPASPADFAKVLGGDAAQFQPTLRGPLGVDLTRPVADQTAAQIVGKLGDKPAPARAAERKAVVLVYNAQQPAPPKEVRALVDGRKEWREGNVQVLFVLWPPS